MAIDELFTVYKKLKSSPTSAAVTGSTKIFRRKHFQEAYRKLQTETYPYDFAPEDITEFWNEIQHKPEQEDQRFAGYFIGMTITALRQKGNNTQLEFEKINLDNFAYFGRNITNITIHHVAAEGCLRAAGSYEGTISHITLGRIDGHHCLAFAGSYRGRIHDIKQTGSINGHGFLAWTASHEGKAARINLCGTGKGLNLLARAGEEGKLYDLSIQGRIKPLYKAGIRGTLEHITINNTHFPNPTAQELNEFLKK